MLAFGIVECRKQPVLLYCRGAGSHLFLADGMLLFAEATMEQMDTILECLNYFCAILGQKVSAAKTIFVCR
jgi:hypothetical protein